MSRAGGHYYKPVQGPRRRFVVPFNYRGYALEFVSYEGLFSRDEVDAGTELLLEHAVVPESGVVLDVGCGYGIIGISIAKAFPNVKVYMTDVNPLAVEAARQNAKRNGVSERVFVMQGDRYEPVKGMKFDAIFSNPPLAAGMEIVRDIVLGARDYLAPGGHAQFVLAKGGERLAAEASRTYSAVEMLKKKSYILLTLRP
ncbi:MAG: methyltransferase [Desulfurococcaceae archaeon]